MHHLRACSVATLALCVILLPARRVDSAPLVIDRCIETVGCIVHELPPDQDRQAALAYVRMIRDRFYPRLELIDGAATSQKELAARAANGFVLYSVIHPASKLLGLTAGPFGLKVDGRKMTFGPHVLDGQDLRIVYAGKNPYGKGPCVVYAAETNKLLVEVNRLMHGPCSFHAFSGSDLLREGSYSDRFEFAPEALPAPRALEDVREFFESIERIHPDPLAKTSGEDYLKLKEEVVADVVRSAGKDGTVTLRDLAYSLYRAAAALGDGHTSLRWQYSLNGDTTRGDRFPPFTLEFRNGEFQVTAAAAADLVGARIEALDGRSFVEFLAPVLARLSGETLPFKAHRFVMDQGFWWSFSGLLRGRKTLAIKGRARSGSPVERTLETIEFGAYDTLVKASRGAPGKRPRRETSLRYFDGKVIAYLLYPAFRESREEREKLSGIFADILRQGSRELVIDLRGNGGGNSGMGDFIFGHLTARPFFSYSCVKTRISRDLVESRDGHRKFSSLIGLTTADRGAETADERCPSRVRCRVTLLIDNGTFSSAADFATMFRDYEIGEIVGYESGGLPASFGDVFQKSLPASGISYGVSYKQFLGPRPRPGDDEHGVLPTVPLTDALLAPYRGSDDPALDFTLDRVRKGAPAARR